MLKEGRHYRDRDDWTNRQKQVLDLLARGRTNGEIAVALGITLDGAKYHVSEVITRLGVRSRDEAAEYWRTYNGRPARVRRALLTLGGWGIPNWAGTVTAAVVLAGLVAVAAFVLLDQDGDAPFADDATPAPAQTATTAAPTATPGVAPEPREVTGLSTEPQEREPDAVFDLPDLTPTFPPPQGCAAVFDTESGETIDLGEGMLPQFSPDGSRVAWAAGEVCDGNPSGPFEVRVMELATREVRALGSGDRVTWVSDEEIVFAEPGTNDWVRLNLVTGEETSQGNPWADDHQSRMAKEYGYYMDRGVLRDAENERAITRLDVYAFVPLDEEHVVIATRVSHMDLRTNLFLLNLTTLEAEFLVSAEGSRINWPLTARGSKVMWVPHYCRFSDDLEVQGYPGAIHVYDIETDELKVIRSTVTNSPDPVPRLWAELIDEARFTLGPFADSAVINVETLEAELVFPLPVGSWSEDRRYAATGMVGGHGGLCIGG